MIRISTGSSQSGIEETTLSCGFRSLHEYIKIPLAQEFRAFYGIGDMIASKMMGGELAEESWSQYAEDLLGQVVDMLPLDPTGYDGNIAVSLMPNAIRPV